MQMGWIDLSTRDRNRILSVLSLLSIPGAVDELGTGVVRDGFSDVLFPGTSTIQTRAKYFLLVPYILMELEKEKNMTPRELLSRLTKEEIKLIKILNRDNAEGVIGARAGESLQRKPSSIYWNGIVTFGIFNSPQRMSLNEYAQAVCAIKKQKNLLSSTGHADQGEGTDDIYSIYGLGGNIWRAPYPETDWRNEVTIDLTEQEALFLRERIIRSERSKNSLLAFILKNHLTEIIEYSDLAMIGARFGLPPELKTGYEMALRFSRFVYGATIRYNIILSNGDNPDADKEWTAWYQSVKEGFIKNYDVSEPFKYLSLSGGNVARLLPFLKKWQETVLLGDCEKMDKLIIAREIQLKGRERAKLNNRDLFRWREGIWLGTRLQYRYSNARKLMEDIFEGLGDGNHV
ncbi:MAG: hypothetical protein GX581_02050 [Syntrophomonadaceae bacterium]|jgi:hypothetical protein|nr:hypothetical protein [Syntrophomonadaceae bacterium]